MLLDVRVYTCRPGTIAKHLALYAEKGAGPQSRNLGNPVIHAKCETGDPNQYIHVWLYDSAADREAKRAAMWADPEWVAYTQASAQLGALASQQNSLWSPVDFFGSPQRTPERRHAPGRCPQAGQVKAVAGS